MKAVVPIIFVLSAPMVLSACTQEAAPAPASASASESAAQGDSPPLLTAADGTVIEIRNYMFMEVTVPAGTKVTWVNRDDVPHTVIEKHKAWRSPALDTDDKYSHVFDKPGTYAYFCSLHPEMVSKVVVTAR